MKNRTIRKNWDDVKMVIATLAVTLTLVFWNFFSKLEHREVVAVIEEESLPQPTATQPVQTPLPVQPTNPGIIYFQSGSNDLTVVATPQSSQKPSKETVQKPQNAPRPEPITNTSSSR